MALSWHDAVQDELFGVPPLDEPIPGSERHGVLGAVSGRGSSSGVPGRVTDRSRSSRPPLEPPAILWFAVGLMLGIGIALLAAAPA